MGGGTGNKGQYKVGHNEDGEGMCTSVASLEPDPRYTGCCANIFRRGRVVRDLIVGSLVVLVIAVVVAVVFAVCFFLIPDKSGATTSNKPGEEGAFHGVPFKDDGSHHGINEVEFNNSTRYEVDPHLEKTRKGGNETKKYEGHAHEGHKEHHQVGPVPEAEPEPEPEPTSEPEPEPKAEGTVEPEPEPERDHTHGKGTVAHDHTHPDMDHNHTHPDMDHNHTHPAMEHDQDTNLDMDNHTLPESNHDHTHPEMDHNHTHPEMDHNHTHPESDHDHTHPPTDHEHTHELGPVTLDHTHPEMDHDHTHPAMDHHHTHPEMGHNHTHEQGPVAQDHTHPADGTTKATDTEMLNIPGTSESEMTVIPTTDSTKDREEDSLPPLFKLFSASTPIQERVDENSEGTLKELAVPQGHFTEETHHATETHPEVTLGTTVAGRIHETPLGKCQPRQLEMCSDLPHVLTAFPNWAGDQTEEDLQQTSLPFLRDVIVRSRCSPRAKEYSCAILEPPCTPDGTILPPCRTFCKSVASTCQEFITSRFSLSSAFNCEKFPDSSDPNVCFDMTNGSVSVDNTTALTQTTEEAEGTETTLPETTTLLQEAETFTAAHCPELQCLDGTCISLSQVNNGVVDCPEGIDEEDFGGLL